MVALFAAGALFGIKGRPLWFQFYIRRCFYGWQLRIYQFRTGAFTTAAQYPIMADAYKATRQYMQAEAADKFHIIQLHGFGYAAVFIIFVRKVHFTVFMFFNR